MKTYNFTHKELLDEVVRVGEDDPEFVYVDNEDEDDLICSYLGQSTENPTGQCCIVGQALQNLGVDREDLLEVEGVVAWSAVSRLLGESIQEGISVDKELNTIWMIQGFQDDGNSWGRSVKLGVGDYNGKH